jgi:hypothetical protein
MTAVMLLGSGARPEREAPFTERTPGSERAAWFRKRAAGLRRVAARPVPFTDATVKALDDWLHHCRQ